MGLISSLFDGVVAVVSSVAYVAAQTVSAAWRATKRVAAQAMGWMADRAESAVGAIRQAWQGVKSAVDNVRQRLAATAREARFPWVAGLAKLAESLLGAISAPSPLLKRLGDAIDWVIRAAQSFRDRTLNAWAFEIVGTLEEAERHRRTFDDVHARETERQRSIEVLAMIADYITASRRIQEILDTDAVADFEHYLRLRATQKLLAEVHDKFINAQAIADFTPDDIFLLRIAANLVRPDPQLTEEEAKHLDELLVARTGQRLARFVFEEILEIWNTRLARDLAAYRRLDDRLAQEQTDLTRLRFAQQIEGLPPAEQARLAELEAAVQRTQDEVNAAADRVQDLKTYLYASYGFLHIVEKTPQELEAEDRGYLVDDGARVGELVVACTQKDVPLKSLPDEDQSRLIDFANIFELDFLNRQPPVGF